MQLDETLGGGDAIDEGLYSRQLSVAPLAALLRRY